MTESEIPCAIRYVDVPGYPAPHSPYSHAVVAKVLYLCQDRSR